MDEDEFEKDQEKKIISSFNDQQKIYYISSKIELQSKNPVYIAYRRTYRLSHHNNEDHSESKNDTKYHNDSQNKDLEDDEIHYDEKKTYALKLLKYYTKKQTKTFDKEKDIIELFDDDSRIIKYLEIIPVILYNRKHILVSMYFYPNVDLLFYLWRPTFRFDENLVCLIAFKALKILSLLKSRGVVHNDIKFENFIVSSEDPFEIILTDFESAQMVDINGNSNSMSGTAVFKAPEVLRGEEHDYAADMWSLGMNIYFHLYFEYPFGIDEVIDSKSEKGIEKKINSSKLTRPRKTEGKNVSEIAWNCVSAMLDKDPENRVKVDDALEHEWFSFIESSEMKYAVSRFNIEENLDFEDESPTL